MDKIKREEKFADYDTKLEEISLAIFKVVSPPLEGSDTDKYEHVVISIAALTSVVAEVLKRFGDMEIISTKSADKLREGVRLLDRSIGIALVQRAMKRMNTAPPTTLADLDEKTATKQ